MKKKEDLFLFRNQVRTLYTQLYTDGSFLNADNLTSFAYVLYSRAVGCFGEKEVKNNLPKFSRHQLVSTTSSVGRNLGLARIRELMDSMGALLAYLDYKLGDPVALELFSDNLAKAREVLDRDMNICSVLLCRVTLEQSLRRLCDRNHIEYAPNEKASTMAEKLRKPNGILEVHEWKELDARLTLENKVIHNETSATKDMAKELIEWTERFIDHYLEGK